MRRLKTTAKTDHRPGGPGGAAGPFWLRKRDAKARKQAEKVVYNENFRKIFAYCPNFEENCLHRQTKKACFTGKNMIIC
jgi:hypothetical protein